MTLTTRPDVDRASPEPAPAPPPQAVAAQQRRVKALARFGISITALTVVGHLVLGFETSWLQVGVTAATAYALELVLETIDAWEHGRRARYRGGLRNLVVFLLPAHIAAFSLSLLIYPGTNLWGAVLAAVIAVASKHLLKAPIAGRMRHVMNPSNVAIAVVLTFYSWVGPAPSYMFTENITGVWDAVVPLVLLVFGLFLNVKLTKRGPLIAAWVGGFAAQAVVKGLLPGDDFSAVSGLLVMTGATFVLFTNYMITDPSTTPESARGQVVFGLVAATCYGVLSAVGVTYGLFYCVVATCALRGCWHWGVELVGRIRAARAADAPSRSEVWA